MTPPKQQYQDLGEKDELVRGDIMLRERRVLSTSTSSSREWHLVPDDFIGMRVALFDNHAFKFRRPIPASSEVCPTCDGTGRVHSHNPQCWDCEGSGIKGFTRRKPIPVTSSNLAGDGSTRETEHPTAGLLNSPAISASSEEKADNNFGQCGVEGHAACGLAKPMQVGTPEMVSQHNEMRNVASPDHQQAPVGLHGEVASKQVSSPATVHSIQPTAASEEAVQQALCGQIQSLTRQNEELKRENEKLSAVLQMANNNTRRRDNKIQSLRAELEQARKELSAAGEGQRARDDAPISAKSPQQSAAELVSDDSKSQADWLVSCWQSSHDIFPNLEGCGAERRYSDLRSRIAERLDAEHKLSDHLGKQVAALRNRNADLWRKINKDEQRKELIASNKANQRLKAECLEFREYANIHLKDLSAALSNLDAATDELKKVREALRQIQILCLRPQQEDWPLEKRHLAGAVSAIAQSALNKQEGE